MEAGEGTAQAPAARAGQKLHRKPFTDPRTGEAMRAVDRVAFAVATLKGAG